MTCTKCLTIRQNVSVRCDSKEKGRDLTQSYDKHPKKTDTAEVK